MAIAFCNFIRLKRRSGSYLPHNYQNFFVGQAVTYQSVAYDFLGFAAATGSGKRGGDRSSGSLVTAPGPISTNIFAEAADNRYLVEVRTVEVDALSLAIQGLISSEIWLVTGLESSTERSILNLSSPLDAVDGQVPSRYLSSALVGALPTSGTITLS
jgi:hypothetical protein